VTPIGDARARRSDAEPGLVEQEIRAALESVGAEDRLARSLLAIAVSLARELDNPRGSVAQTAAQLQALVKEALKGSGGSGGTGLEGLTFGSR
jgi:hypothetical protein